MTKATMTLSREVEASVRRATKEVVALERLKRASLWYALRGRVAGSEENHRRFLKAEIRLGLAALNYASCVQLKERS
jgi:hypothetical protein